MKIKKQTHIKWPLVSIVIVNCNGTKHLSDCLHSILNTNYINFEIIVVDNASVDDSIKTTKQILDPFDIDYKIIKNKINLGPSTARNQGIKIAKGKYIAFLDNDTKVHPAWLKDAIKVFELDFTVGACQCKLILDGTDNIIDCIGEYLGQYGFLVYEVTPGEIKDVGQYNHIMEIFAAKSAGMIARKDALEKINGFDDDFFIYMEESDLCWRIWLQGYKVVLIPSSIVYHKFGTSSIILPEKINYLVKFHGTKNYISTLTKNLEFKNLIKVLPMHIVMWLGIAFAFLLKRQLRNAKWVLQGISWNFVNFRRIIKKRKIVQKQRTVKDEEIFPKIVRNKHFTYFLEKFKSKKKIGYARGWG